MKLRLPRYSLRLFLGLVFVVAILAGFYGSRHTRFHGRVAAKLELEAWGFRFVKPADVPADWELEPGSTSEFVRWFDCKCFGETAHEEYSLVVVDVWEMLNKVRERKKTPAIGKLLWRFAEIQAVIEEPATENPKHSTIVRQYFTDKDTAENAILLREHTQAIARLPELRIYRADCLSPIDDAWAEALPTPSPLRELCGSHRNNDRYDTASPRMELTPAGALQLLAKAQNLHTLTLNHAACDRYVVAELNRREWNTTLPTKANDFGTYTKHLRILATPPSTPEQPFSLAEELSGLTANFAVTRDYPIRYSPFDNQQTPANVSRFTAAQLACSCFSSLHVSDSPQLQELCVKACQGVQVADCAHLNSVRVGWSGDVTLRNLPAVREVFIYYSGQINIADCQKVEALTIVINNAIYGFKKGMIDLPALPRLESLTMLKTNWSIASAPELKTLITDFPGENQQLKLLQFPKLQRLTLVGGVENYSEGKLEELNKLPELKALKLEFQDRIFLGSREEFYRDLRGLKNIRCLWIDNVEQAALYTSHNPRQLVLPPNLEVLICERGFSKKEELELLRRTYPNLIYVILNDIEPKYGNLLPRKNMNLSFDNLPSIAELRKLAEP